jgi:hypothetical protein
VHFLLELFLLLLDFHPMLLDRFLKLLIRFELRLIFLVLSIVDILKHMPEFLLNIQSKFIAIEVTVKFFDVKVMLFRSILAGAVMGLDLWNMYVLLLSIGSAPDGGTGVVIFYFG